MSPRLRSAVQVFRQHFRGRMWHVLQDPGSNQFHRLSGPAYHFIALLDGRRKVAEVWDICNEDLGDDAPTQGEVIRLLGQLYSSNLLTAEISPDTQGLFSRYKKRVSREVKGYLTNLLFIRVPIFDPDHLLDAWVKVFGLLFSKVGLICWLALLCVGGYFALINWQELGAQSMNILNPDHLWMLGLSFIAIKAVHEFGHAFACKKFGQYGGGGEVHVMGIMFLVFMPLPYVDATSATAFRSKWHRVIVGAGGMFSELAVAAIAAIVWGSVGDGTVRVIAYNFMFIASVMTLLFNANPLLRYDGYFILADILEIPNLSQRAKQYLQFLVKKYVWSVRNLQNPAHTNGERFWFVIYGIASSIYRVFILVMILLFLSNRLPEQLKVLAVGMGFISGAIWLCMPIGKLIRYLATNNELARTRGRAVATVVGLVVAIVVLVGFVKFPDRFRAEGVVEPVDFAIIYANTDGYVGNYLPSGTKVFPDGPPILNDPAKYASKQAMWEKLNSRLAAEHTSLVAQIKQVEVQWRMAVGKAQAAGAQVLARRLEDLRKSEVRVRSDLEGLTIFAGFKGTWDCPKANRLPGHYAKKGDEIGKLVSLDKIMIRVVAKQEAVIALRSLRDSNWVVPIEIRVKGRPDPAFGGKVTKIFPAGSTRLPSAALGYAAGGMVAVKTDDKKGTTAINAIFEFHVSPDLAAVNADRSAGDKVVLKPGQRVVVRFEAPAKPLIWQWWRSLQQLLMRN